MIIVSGRLFLRSGSRAEFIALSLDAIRGARATAGCLDFSVSADPIDENRVNIYEEWESEAALLKFRAEGPEGRQLELIERAEVRERTQ